MQKYVLRFEAKGSTDPQEVTFSAASVQEALEIAKTYAIGDWAELHQDGVVLSRMQLVDDGGVWRISGISPHQ